METTGSSRGARFSHDQGDFFDLGGGKRLVGSYPFWSLLNAEKLPAPHLPSGDRTSSKTEHEAPPMPRRRWRKDAVSIPSQDRHEILPENGDPSSPPQTQATCGILQSSPLTSWALRASTKRWVVPANSWSFFSAARPISNPKKPIPPSHSHLPLLTGSRGTLLDYLRVSGWKTAA